MPSPAPRPGFPRRTVLAAGAALPLAAVGLAACAGDEDQDGAAFEPDLLSDVDREQPGPADGAGAFLTPFAARMLGALPREEINLVCSPLSAQVALTMAGLGAGGATRSQMEEVLGGSIDELAAAANTLSAGLAAVGDAEREKTTEEAPEPAVASLVNGTWLQKGYEVEQDFLDGLATHFGSGVYEVDFADAAAREKGRERINEWVADSTHDLIEELVEDGMLDDSTRLVLVSALHLKAAWLKALGTEGGVFTTADGQERSVELLTGSAFAWYEDDLVRATALRTYGDQLALALVQPVKDLPTVLDGWSAAADGGDGSGLAALLAGLEDSPAGTRLSVPGFDIAWDEELGAVLEDLGISDAFSSGADLSGITAEEKLVISSVVQKAVITVDEEGMEAAAATAIGVGTTAAPLDEHELVLDAPFLYVAYERSTRAPLVLGWIGDPTQTR